MKKRAILPPLLLIASALLLAACGSSGSSDESQIEEAIETSATSKDPATCSKYQTQKFLEQNAQASGNAALKDCEREAGEPGKAESVAVSEIEVSGEKANADAAVSGGSLDGQTLEVELVKEGEQWKLNQLTGFAKLDQAKLVEAFKREFEKSSEVSPSLANCIVEGLEEASKPEIEELVLSGTGKGFEELAESCA